MFGGEICDARFSKSCGGITELYENVWEAVHHPYLVNVSDTDPPGGIVNVSTEGQAQAWIRGTPPAFCNTVDRAILSHVLLDYDRETTDFYRWSVTYEQEELEDIIARKSGVGFGRILDLVPEERGPSGRLTRLRIVGEHAALTIGKELEIRRTLSPSHLRSSAFVVDKLGVNEGFPRKFHLRGAGWGHGVGLCQIGAAVMGEQGYTPEAILDHYFSAAEIRRAY
jgi:SpoIID/LytB domain protein